MAQRDLLVEARGYAQQLVEILPCPEAYLRLAQVVALLEEKLSALEMLRQVKASGYITRVLLLQEGLLLLDLGQARNAAQLLDQAADKYAGDYRIAFLCGTAWLAAQEFDRAINTLEPLIGHREASAGLLINIATAYLQKSATQPDLADRAFDLLARAFKMEPTEPSLPARLVLAGEASGRSREAWDLVGRLDLSQNPHLRSVPIDEAVPLIKELTERLRQREALTDAGMIPYATFAGHAPRSAWFLWWAGMSWFRRRWEEGDIRAKPTVVAMPSIGPDRTDESLLRRGVVLDMTALLTLGTLGVTREILESLHGLECPVFLFPDCAKWLDHEVARLRSDQLPWYRRRYQGVQTLIEAARHTVDIRVQPSPNMEKLPAEVRKVLGSLCHDIEEAVLPRAYYLDDYLDAAQSAAIPAGIVVRSSDVLASLVHDGLVLPRVSEDVRRQHPRPFAEGESRVVPLDRSIVASEHSLLAWYESGLLGQWVKGGEGWPRLIVGPLARESLASNALEAQLYQEALQRAVDSRTILEEYLQLNWLQESASVAGAELSIGVLDELWRPALDLLTIAKDRGLALWTDDLFLHVVFDPRKLVSSEDAFHKASLQLGRTFGGVPVLGTEPLLRLLTRAQAIPAEREGELAWTLFSHGYRFLRLRGAIRWLLKTVPYEPERPAFPYRRLLSDLERIPTWMPRLADPERAKALARATLYAVAGELISEVWSVDLPTLEANARRQLSEVILGIFERGSE